MRFLGTVTTKRIYLKHQIFVKTVYFFQNATWSSPFFKVVSLYLKKGVVIGNSLFQPYWLLLDDQIEPSILSWRVMLLKEKLEPSILSRIIWNR